MSDYQTEETQTSLNPSNVIALPAGDPLHTVLADSHVTFFTQDLDLRYTRMYNPQLGYAMDEVIGKVDADLFTEDDAMALTAIKQGVIDTGQPVRQTVRTTGNGVLAYYDLIVEPLRDNNGSIIGVTCAATDVTEHRQRADKLRFQATVLDALTDAVVAVDVSGRILYWNHGAETLFGYTSDEMLGQTPGRLFSPEERSEFSRYFRTVMDGRAHSGQWRAIHKTGAECWFEMTVRAIHDSEGNVTSVVGVGKDITDRKLAEDDQRFRTTVLESIHDSVIATDLAGRITYWNRGAEDIFGYRAEDMLGQTLERLYPDGDAQTLEVDLADIAEGNDYHGEWKGVRSDGESLWLNIRTTAVRDSTGECVGFVGVSKDITLRKQAELARDISLKKEQVSRHRLRQFLALVAHDLRNPITIVSAYGQLLKRRTMDLGSPGYAQSIDGIESASHLMHRLVGDLADAAAAGEGKFGIQPVSMNIVELVHDVVAECQASTDKHVIHVDCPAAIKGHWDPQRVRQLLSNLVDNAIKYSPAGGDVHVMARATADKIMLSIKDEGVGMSREEQEDLFDIFARGDDSRNVSGFGLGLYICRAIVEAHDGRIDVESEPGEGSTFRVVLPLTCEADDDL